nr:unnamed protein product [Salmo salar]|eukprot:XP_013998634.1 PREDICTED: SH3 domain-binding protein 5-like [Salmo salar]
MGKQNEELEHLNQASDEINKLELKLDDARSSYRRILTDSARKLNAQGSQLGTCIEKARPYYEARRLTKEAQQETQKAALRYERAVSMHTAAREMVYVAEQGLLADRNTLDPTWQEMLNHATSKVNEAEEERLRSEREHQRVTQLCQEAEQRVQTLQKSLKRVIVKSKPYFELKAQFNHILEEHKANVVQLEERVAKVKMRYSVALRNLEQISEQIHAQRGRVRATRAHPVACGGRSSPVGAEAEVRVQVGGACGRGGGLEEKDWADGEKTRHLQTIASDLGKCDSVEHLGDLSDVSSLMGEDWERERDQSLIAENRDRDGNPRAEERVVRDVSSLMGKDWEKERSLIAKNRDGNPKAEERVVRDVVIPTPRQDRLEEVREAIGRERQESFVKQHHRSVSL